MTTLQSQCNTFGAREEESRDGEDEEDSGDEKDQDELPRPNIEPMSDRIAPVLTNINLLWPKLVEA